MDAELAAVVGARAKALVTARAEKAILNSYFFDFVVVDVGEELNFSWSGVNDRQQEVTTK